MIDKYIVSKREGARYTGQHVSERTLEDYYRILTSVQQFKEKPLHEWTYDDAHEYIRYRTAEGKSANTINLEMVVCRGFFAWYYQHIGSEEENPFSGIPKKKKDSKYPVILSKEQIQELFPKNKLFNLVFKMMYYGGLRNGEVRNLLKTNVQDRGILIMGKGNKERFIPLHPKLLEELKTFIKKDKTDSPYVFHYDYSTGPIGERALQKRFKTALKKAGIQENATPHNLRHTCASHMYAGSLDVVATKDLLGHENIATTMIYVKLHRDEVENAYQKAFDY